MVEAVGLGGRTIGVDRHPLDSWIVDGFDRRGGRRVVAVMADENPVIFIFETIERRSKHCADHGRFVPGGHEDDDEALFVAAIGDGLAERPRVSAVDGR